MADLKVVQQSNPENPTVKGNSVYLDTTEFIFSVQSFTKDFIDPKGGSYENVVIKSLMGVDGLLYDNSTLFIGDTFPANSADKLKFTLGGKYAIHNGVLYEFAKDIDLIISDYKAIGFELVANTNGLLTFVELNNLSNIQYEQGEAVTEESLTFKFATTSSVTGSESNKATFSIIPWENVNLKDNYYPTGVVDGADGDSAYQVALNQGFVGTVQDWLDSLQGATGPVGETGATGQDGADGTSVTIKGSYPTKSDLETAQPTGTAGDGYLVNGYLYTWNGSAWENVGLIQGPRGYDGRSLEYQWNGTQLGIRYEGQINFNYIDLKGARGEKGNQGDQGIQGIQGPKGDTGLTGGTGESAYQIWLDLGNAGTKQTFIDSLKGEQGIQGEEGPSIYEVWLSDGNTGTIPEFLATLKGAKGDVGEKGEAASFTHNEVSFDWTTGQSQIFPVSDAFAITDVYVDGKRAEKNNPDSTPDEWEVYSPTEIRITVPLENNDRVTLVESAKFSAVELDFEWRGTELGVKRNDQGAFTYTELKGAQGDQGIQGIQGIQGETGDSAYQTWLDAGNVGTKDDFLLSLKGATGDQGPVGPAGADGSDANVTQANVEAALGHKSRDMPEATYNALGTKDADTYYFLYE